MPSEVLRRRRQQRVEQVLGDRVVRGQQRREGGQATRPPRIEQPEHERRRAVPAPDGSRAAGLDGRWPTATTWQRHSSVEAHARIEQGVGDVGQEVDEHDDDPRRRGSRLDDREVAMEDRVDHQLADSGDGEDLLDDERAADEEADVDAEDRDGRDDRVAERVVR